MKRTLPTRRGEKGRLTLPGIGNTSDDRNPTRLEFEAAERAVGLARESGRFLVLNALRGSPYTSAVVAAAFGIHPLHVESVAWISERKDVLSAFFGLMSQNQLRHPQASPSPLEPQPLFPPAYPEPDFGTVSDRIRQ